VSETLPLGVDLCLQDNYFDPGNSPVDGETWHYWLETWLGYLSDYLPVAATQNHSLARELAWLTAHACLHLLGWDHPDETSLLEMLSLQETLLKTVEMPIHS